MTYMNQNADLQGKESNETKDVYVSHYVILSLTVLLCRIHDGSNDFMFFDTVERNMKIVNGENGL